MGEILSLEKPIACLLTGSELHHDVPGDSVVLEPIDRHVLPAIGIRSGVYWRHENGKQGITLEFVRLYARAFAVDPGWLAFGNRRSLT